MVLKRVGSGPLKTRREYAIPLSLSYIPLFMFRDRVDSEFLSVVMLSHGEN
jgi:hypothetical protein